MNPNPSFNCLKEKIIKKIKKLNKYSNNGQTDFEWHAFNKWQETELFTGTNHADNAFLDFLFFGKLNIWKTMIFSSKIARLLTEIVPKLAGQNIRF